VGTIGFTGIQVSFDQTSSNTGPKDFELQYSTDGTSFTNIAAYSVLANGGSPNASWNGTTASSAYNFSYDLSSASVILGQSTVYFRLIDLDTIAENGGTVASTGTDRVDNFTVTAIPEPSTYAMVAGLAGLGFAILRRRRAAAQI
jgi:hypothetical protein